MSPVEAPARFGRHREERGSASLVQPVQRFAEEKSK
jgi:hypothetical protein